MESIFHEKTAAKAATAAAAAAAGGPIRTEFTSM
ncbi:ataxin-3 isoform ae [Homo sapiens]|nr:ataxin-3 isoform ae [Homo sapiens]|eukprot:NP_001158254.1 ataxin-3 isoform ae [Homo sapiens]